MITGSRSNTSLLFSPSLNVEVIDFLPFLKTLSPCVVRFPFTFKKASCPRIWDWPGSWGKTMSDVCISENLPPRLSYLCELSSLGDTPLWAQSFKRSFLCISWGRCFFTLCSLGPVLWRQGSHFWTSSQSQVLLSVSCLLVFSEHFHTWEWISLTRKPQQVHFGSNKTDPEASATFQWNNENNWKIFILILSLTAPFLNS